MNENSDAGKELLPHFEAVEDVSNFRAKWKEVIDNATEGFNVSGDERDEIVAELINSHMEEEKEVSKDDVLYALGIVRTSNHGFQ